MRGFCRPETEELILHDIATYDAEWGHERFTNHTIPALVAMDLLGVSLSAMKAWHENYCYHMEPCRERDSLSVSIESVADLTAWLGKRRHLPELRECCERMLQEGKQDVLIDLLHCDMGVEAFHGLILAGWGLRCKSPVIRAFGFGFWAYYCDRRVRSVDRTPGKFRPDELLECVAAMRKTPQIMRLAVQCDPSFKRRFEEVEKAFPDGFDVVMPSEFDSRQLFTNLKESFSRLFILSGSRDFFLLHAITGTEAMSQLAALVWGNTELIRKCVRALWRHALVTMVAQNMPVIADQMPPPLQETPGMLDQAIAHDEHLAKLALMGREAGPESLQQQAYVSAMQNVVIDRKGFVFNPPPKSRV